jgi:hypothetical protein
VDYKLLFINCPSNLCFFNVTFSFESVLLARFHTVFVRKSIDPCLFYYLSVCFIICLSVLLSVCLFYHLSVCFIICLSVCFIVCLSVFSSVCLFSHLYVCFVICLTIFSSECLLYHLSVCFIICLSVLPLSICFTSVYLFYLCLSVLLSVCLSILSSVWPSVLPSVCLFYYLSVCFIIANDNLWLIVDGPIVNSPKKCFKKS